jgi:colanic acid biosynthesis glycosyl transferase WcaI
VISEGHGVEWLAQRQRKFPGLVLLPFQTADDFRMALASADVLVAVLEPKAAKFSVPAKVLTYMAAGRAILAAIEKNNLAARTVLAASAGMVADPSDPEAVRRLARALIEDDDLRRRCADAALAYARSHFEIDAIASRFEHAVRRFIGGRRAPQEDARGRGEPASVSR